MAQFPRPEKAIGHYNELKKGQHIFHVTGSIYPVQYAARYGEFTVLSEAMLYRHHPKFNEGSTQGELFVFDVEYSHNPFGSVMEFAGDGNLVPGHSHNDNYWFRTEEDAQAAVAFLNSQWEMDPDLIERKRAAIEEISERMEETFDDLAFDESNDDDLDEDITEPYMDE